VKKFSKLEEIQKSNKLAQRLQIGVNYAECLSFFSFAKIIGNSFSFDINETLIIRIYNTLFSEIRIFLKFL